MAITGPSGSGKSTLAKIIAGYETREYEGSIYINGVSYTQKKLEAIRTAVTLCEQDVKFLPYSIQDNLSLQNSGKTDDIMALSKELGIHRTVLKLPKGYDTVAFSDFTNMLSGGQMQLLALVRVLVKDPYFLVLDEITSAMDFKTEQRALTVLREYRKGKSIIYITHRITTIQYFKEICVLNEGKLDGFGSHDELLKKSEVYKGLVDVSTYKANI